MSWGFQISELYLLLVHSMPQWGLWLVACFFTCANLQSAPWLDPTDRTQPSLWDRFILQAGILRRQNKMVVKGTCSRQLRSRIPTPWNPWRVFWWTMHFRIRVCVSKNLLVLFCLVIFRGRPQQSGKSIQSHNSISSLKHDMVLNLLASTFSNIYWYHLAAALKIFMQVCIGTTGPVIQVDQPKLCNRHSRVICWASINDLSFFCPYSIKRLSCTCTYTYCNFYVILIYG